MTRLIDEVGCVLAFKIFSLLLSCSPHYLATDVSLFLMHISFEWSVLLGDNQNQNIGAAIMSV